VTTCVVCQARTDTALCAGCTSEIEKVLAEIPADHADLTAVATRQATGPLGLGDNRGGRQWTGPFEDGSLGDSPWVYAPGAADQLWAMENTLTTWARHLAETNGLELPDTAMVERFTTTTWVPIRRNRAVCVNIHTIVAAVPVEPSVIIAARWLQSNLALIRRDQAAYEIHDELTALAVENQTWILGRSEPTVFAGKCDAPDVRVDVNGDTLRPRVAVCGADLYAHEGDDTVRCGACGQSYPLAKRREMIRERLADEWARAQVIADALTTNDEPLNAATLRSWILRDSKLSKGRRATVDRPLILQVGIDDDGHPLYRVGDVRARIAWSRELARRERIGA